MEETTTAADRARAHVRQASGHARGLLEAAERLLTGKKAACLFNRGFLRTGRRGGGEADEFNGFM